MRVEEFVVVTSIVLVYLAFVAAMAMAARLFVRRYLVYLKLAALSDELVAHILGFCFDPTYGRDKTVAQRIAKLRARHTAALEKFAADAGVHWKTIESHMRNNKTPIYDQDGNLEHYLYSGFPYSDNPEVKGRFRLQKTFGGYLRWSTYYDD